MAKRLQFLAEETRRRKPIRRAPSKRNSVTTGQVQKYLRTHPDADYEEIATALNANVGRVSEALRGIRR